MNPRRLRAMLLMIFLWGISAAFIGGLYGVGLWLWGPTWQHSLFWDAVSINALIFTSGGVLGGATFALMLSRQREGSAMGDLNNRIGILKWITVGLVCGSVGYLFKLVTSDPRWTLSDLGGFYLWQLVKVAGISAMIGGGVGTGILAIAKRGRELPGETPSRDVGELPSPSE